jgi:hypothetical protein
MRSVAIPTTLLRHQPRLDLSNFWKHIKHFPQPHRPRFYWVEVLFSFRGGVDRL